jgi:diguanylate cyclase (GGDEF)-like protein
MKSRSISSVGRGAAGVVLLVVGSAAAADAVGEVTATDVVAVEEAPGDEATGCAAIKDARDGDETSGATEAGGAAAGKATAGGAAAGVEAIPSDGVGGTDAADNEVAGGEVADDELDDDEPAAGGGGVDDAATAGGGITGNTTGGDTRVGVVALSVASVAFAAAGFAMPRDVPAGAVLMGDTVAGADAVFEARAGREGFPGLLAFGAGGVGLGGCGGSLARRSFSGSMRSSSGASPLGAAAGAAVGGTLERSPAGGSLGASASRGASTGKSGRGSGNGSASGRDLESIISGCDLRQDHDPATRRAASQRAGSQIETSPSSNRDPDRNSAVPDRDAAAVLRHILRWPREINSPAMNLPEPLEHESFPDSAYAQELRRGFPDLRFAPDLEEIFQAFHLERSRARVRFFQLALGLLAIAAAVNLTVLDAVPFRQVAFGWPGVVIPACLALALASWSRFYSRVYLPAARLLLPVIAAVSAVGIADQRIAGHPDLFYFLTSFSIAVFFLGGQLFREALLVDIFMVGALGVALAYAGWPIADAIYYLTVLVITSAVGAFVYQGVERQLRASFLERGLLSEMVARDGLTGLRNRGAFDDDYARLWQQATRDRRSLALLLLDVDHFKAYNDLYGHQAGDKALRLVAQVVQRFARRPLDIAARYGGEEFLLALYDLGAENVREIAEELRESVQALEIEHDDSPASVVTASIGVSIVSPRPGRSPEGAVQLADEALYAAKRGGRNGIRVVDCYEVNYSTGAFRRSA